MSHHAGIVLVFFKMGRLKRMSKKMRVVQVPRAGGPLELVERDIPEPERGWVRVKVEACGVCHSDSLVKEGLWPGIQYPRVPGHEVIGVVDAVGEGVKPWKTGQRVGVGWHAGNCGYCDHCRRGEFFASLWLAHTREFLSMGATPNTWLRRPKRWRLCLTNSLPSTAHH